MQWLNYKDVETKLMFWKKKKKKKVKKISTVYNYLPVDCEILSFANRVGTEGRIDVIDKSHPLFNFMLYDFFKNRELYAYEVKRNSDGRCFKIGDPMGTFVSSGNYFDPKDKNCMAIYSFEFREERTIARGCDWLSAIFINDLKQANDKLTVKEKKEKRFKIKEHNNSLVGIDKIKNGDR